MSYLLIPQVVSENTALVWVGAVDEDVRTVDVSLRYNVINDPEVIADPEKRIRLKLEQSEWRTWKTRNALEKFDEEFDVNVIHYQRVKLRSLLPRTQYTVVLEISDAGSSGTAPHRVDAQFTDYNNILGRDVAASVSIEENRTKATVTTLPKKIPTDPENPFRVMLGSCFYRPNDPDGMVGHTFLNLPEKAQPEIKFLCGDQVYLDNPWKETTLGRNTTTLSTEKMRSYFFQKYLKTWTQVRRKEVYDETGELKTKVIGGFNPLLRNGANYFCSDDHEYWNNAPNFGIVGAVMTFALSQRRWWFREASELFRIFQSLSPWMTFDVSPISFCIADTRINRTRHNLVTEDTKAQFMEADDLRAIQKWIEDLKGPGLLVLGQIVLTEKANRLGYLLKADGTSFFSRVKNLFSDYADFGLPDFPCQFELLRESIRNSRHSIVVLTGDVHFGRISVCAVDKDSEVQFTEIISSPLMAVSAGLIKEKPVFGTYERGAPVFGTQVDSDPIGNSDDPEPVPENHFVTLEFCQKDDKSEDVEMKVLAWKIVDDLLAEGEKVEPIVVRTITLK